MIDPLLQLVIAAALALLLATAALHKRGEPARFRAQLEAYDILPESSLGAMAAALPWAELGIAVLLLPAMTRGGAGIAAALLLLAYAGGMGVNLWRGRADIDCGCGGAAQPLSWSLVLRNLALALVATLLFAPPIERSLAIADLLWLVLLIPLLVLAWSALGEVLRNAALLRPEPAPGHSHGR